MGNSRLFRLHVFVDQSNVNPITIVTEPKIAGQSLAELTGMLAHVRRDLKDGCYMLSYSRDEGFKGDGPDVWSCNKINGLLAELVDMLFAELVRSIEGIPSTDQEVIQWGSDQVLGFLIGHEQFVQLFRPGSVAIVSRLTKHPFKDQKPIMVLIDRTITGPFDEWVLSYFENVLRRLTPQIERRASQLFLNYLQSKGMVTPQIREGLSVFH